MLNAKVAGFPLWLMVGVGILLAAGLIFGTARRRPAKRQEPKPAYEERASYDGDEEPAPA